MNHLLKTCRNAALIVGLAVGTTAAAERLKVENGTILRDGKPFFPLGMVFGWTEPELKRAKDAGFNSVHQEYSMLDVFPDGPEATEQGIAHIRAVHEAARNQGVVLFPLLNGHYIPSWLSAQAGVPPTDVDGKPIGLWFPHSMHNPQYRAALQNFWKTVMETVGDDTNVGAFVMWNEPAYGLDATEYALAGFRQAMKERFQGDIAAFNAECKTDFPDFNAIVLPKSIEENRSFFYLWMDYNIEAQADFFAWEAAELKRTAPGVAVTNKHPVTALSGDAFYCNDIVLNAAYQDIFGCDFYGGSLMHYRNAMEMARSGNPQGPVVTYETHAQKSLQKLQPKMAALQLFVQFLGGARGMFFFCAGENVPNFSFFSDEATPPPVRAELSKLFHLVNDNQSIFAAPRRHAKIAVLNAVPASIHYGGAANSTRRDDYSTRVGQTFDLLRNQHFAVDFISSRQLQSKLAQYEVLVLPSLSILSDADMARVAEFHRGGGKILAFGGALARNEQFEEIAPPLFFGITDRKPAPWNRAAMRITEVVPELADAFRTELIVQAPEIVNPAPMEQVIPGYEAKIHNEGAIWLAANQDAYPNIVQSSDEQVIYCAFDSLYSEALSALLGKIVTGKFGVKREVTARAVGEKAEALELLSALSDDGETPVLLLANAGPQDGAWVLGTSETVTAWRDIATGTSYPANTEGEFSVALPGYGYGVFVGVK